MNPMLVGVCGMKLWTPEGVNGCVTLLACRYLPFISVDPGVDELKNGVVYVINCLVNIQATKPIVPHTSVEIQTPFWAGDP